MSETFGDLMSEYDQARDAARRFDSWERMDKLAEKLINKIQPKVEKQAKKWSEFSYDDMGTRIDD